MAASANTGALRAGSPASDATKNAARLVAATLAIAHGELEGRVTRGAEGNSDVGAAAFAQLTRALRLKLQPLGAEESAAGLAGAGAGGAGGAGARDEEDASTDGYVVLWPRSTVDRTVLVDGHEVRTTAGGPKGALHARKELIVPSIDEADPGRRFHVRLSGKREVPVIAPPASAPLVYVRLKCRWSVAINAHLRLDMTMVHAGETEAAARVCAPRYEIEIEYTGARDANPEKVAGLLRGKLWQLAILCAQTR